MKQSVVLSIYCKHKQGGFTKRLYRAWQAIAKSGHQVIYIAGSELPVQGKGIRAVILPMRCSEQSIFYWPEFYLRSILTFRRLTKQYQVKTHFVFSFFYASISAVSAIGLSVRTVTLVRGDDVFDAQYKSHAWLRGRVHQLLEKIGIRSSTQVLATSRSMQRAIQERNPAAANITVLPNDITTSAIGISLPQTWSTVNIATVSVLNERKNLHLVLAALAKIKHLDWEYRLIGPDTSGKDYAKTLQHLCKHYGITHRVKFLGWQSHAEQILQDCHLFVFPTLMEGSPNALMEAMGYGLPCLASRIPEVTEVLPSPQLHFSPHDPGELSKKLTAFITDNDYARHIAQQTTLGKQHYQFDWDQHIVSLIDQNRQNTGVLQIV